MFYQVVAVDLSTGKQCPETKYILVSGPGTIHQKTGLWIFHPELGKLPSRYYDSVEVAAYKGHDTTFADENCHFRVSVDDQNPFLEGGNYPQFDIAVGDTLVAPLIANDPDWCDTARIDSVYASPAPAGFNAYDSVGRIFTFVPDTADAGIHFDVYVVVTSGSITRHFRMHIDVAELLPTYVVRLGYIEDQIQGQYCDVPITLEKFNQKQGLSGFDFMMGYDASALSFQLAYEGNLYDFCAWEYFTYRFGPRGGCNSNCPSGQLRVIGLAETNNGGAHPGCSVGHVGYVNTVPATLANLRFLVSNDRTLECQFVPIRFFWYDCGDNVLANYNGSELYLSNDVFDLVGGRLTDSAGFPTFGGSQDQCVISKPEIHKIALRAVDFYNGGIKIICADTIDFAGDINLNGIPYEIADAVMFSNYFLQGLAAFGGHIDGSIAASDTNKDGKVLTIEDFVYLIRVIIGDALPYDHLTPSPNPATFVWDTVTNVVNLSTIDTLGAVYMVVNGNVVPSLHAPHMEMRYQTDNVVTRILVWSLEGAKIVSGDLLSIPSATGIVSVESATYDARAVTSKIEITGTDELPYQVRIGAVHNCDRNQYIDVPLTLENFDRSQGLAGFDFMIGYDASALAFQGAVEGDLYDSCAWEYFTYRFGPPGNCDSACPSGMLRVVGLAETNNGDVHPKPACAVDNPGWVSTAPVTLVRIQFLTGDARTLECQAIPVRFFWMDCGNNVLANHDGSELYLSSSVWQYNEYDISGVEAFPTYRGAQEECVYNNPQLSKVAIRRVDYYNGWVDFLCDFPVESPGDVNVNGIQYEIADLVMFGSYFGRDEAAFDGHVEASTTATDVNRDGVPLTVEDYRYMFGVIVGGLVPDQLILPSPNPTLVYWNPVSGAVQFDTVDSLGVAWLLVEGTVTPVVHGDYMDMAYRSDSGWTKILINATQWKSSIIRGVALEIPGALSIAQIRAATYDARAVHAFLADITDVEEPEGGLPGEFALHANYPNPFNPVTTIAYDLPERADVRIAVYNIMGQLVRTLVDRAESAGQHEVVWDGRDDTGTSVSSGLYLYRMTAGEFIRARKMLLLK